MRTLAVASAVWALFAVQPVGAIPSGPPARDPRTRLREALVVSEGADASDDATRLGQELAKLGQIKEAEAAFRRAIELAPTRWLPYARLADLLAGAPGRWQQRGEVLELLKTGLERTARDPKGRRRLLVSMANFERTVGQTEAARARLLALLEGVMPADLRKRALDLLETMRSDEQEGAMRDWPEPVVPEALRGQLAAAEQALSRGDAREAAAAGERLAAAASGWRAPRWLRARALEALGRIDEAERELRVLVQLQPSHAAAWRRLGLLLAAHGGALDAERCDEALRHALALEPSYFDLWLVRAKVALRRGDPAAARQALDRYLREAPERDPQTDKELTRLRQAVQSDSEQRAQPAPRAATVPSAKARKMYREATEWLQLGDPVGMAPDLLAAALADSPGYVDAAATAYALSGTVPERAVAALWNDGEALLLLTRQLRAVAQSAEARRGLRPLLDRAIELGTSAAYFERGVLALDESDLERGIADLRAYVATAPAPAELTAARLLLAAASGGGRDAVVARAQVALIAGRPAEASELLGGRCDSSLSVERLLMLGVISEWGSDLAAAARCYHQAAAHARGDLEPLRRLAAVLSRAPLELSVKLEPALLSASAAGIPAARWAEARLLLSRGADDEALGRIERFLREATPDDPYRPAATAARARITAARALVVRRVALRRLVLGGGAAGLLLLVLLVLLRGRSLASSLQRRPSLFPEVAQAIFELRHDVLKHRISALGLLPGDPSLLQQVRRMLWEPERASHLVAAAYERLVQAGRGHGAVLRPLSLEPVFGPLWRDLRRAESLLESADAKRPDPRTLSALRRIDGRLRELHAERLGALLRLGPRTRLSAALLSAWIRDVEAEVRVRALPWASPRLLLEGLELEFPVERQALRALFGNLLRNAQAAVADAPGGGVLVRVGEERDATGRRLMVLVVGDSVPGELTMQLIEQRESGRGLAIVRDVVQRWRGHLLVRPESPPFCKGVAACFPA